MNDTDTGEKSGIPLASIDWMNWDTDTDGRPFIRLYTRDGKRATQYFENEKALKKVWKSMRKEYKNSNFIWRDYVYFRPDALVRLRSVKHKELGPSLIFTFRSGSEFIQPFPNQEEMKEHHADIASLLDGTHETTILSVSDNSKTLH